MGKLFNALPDSFLKRVLEGEDEEIVERLLETKKKFETAKDKDMKLRYKEQFSGAFWDLYRALATKVSETMPVQKRLFLRYGLLDLKYLSREDQKMIKSFPFKKTEKDGDEDVPIYYVDEWFIEMKKGNIKPSATDETVTVKHRKQSKEVEKLERKKGALEAEIANLKDIAAQRKLIEESLQALIDRIQAHGIIDKYDGVEDLYTEEQRAAIQEIIDSCRKLLKLDEQMASQMRSAERVYDEIEKLKSMVGEEEEVVEVDLKTLDSEFGVVRQMIKMCVGRQGNHFPVLVSSMLQRVPNNEYNIRPIALKNILDVEHLDPGVFKRRFKGRERRIFPYVILVPGYGNFGICWEPYDKMNKATSRGRLAIPIFAKDPKLAVVVALGDLRWQTAKEYAGYHWMEEGLTGKFYDWITKNKIKGDIKTHFIQQYVLWITKEAQGIQKLDKDIREMFWWYIPFPMEVKEMLSKKGYYYNKLYKNEISKLMAEGKM